MPQFTMNSKTDELLKKEFDFCREKEISHKFLIEKEHEHIIPYKNNEIAKNIYGKVIEKKYKFSNSGIIQRKFPTTQIGIFLYSIYALFQ